MDKLDNLSKFLCLILRHKPQEIGISLDEHGWANIDELIKGFNKRDKDINLDILLEIVSTDNKNRYSITDDNKFIRANQGHSIQVDVELKEITPPDTLYHGTAIRTIDAIKEKGILSMSRLYVHLTDNIDTAITTGKRHGESAIILIASKEMHQDGYKFYKSLNNVYLTKFIPTKYLIMN
jgi:putative RNA 2'-phosphotransferase